MRLLRMVVVVLVVASPAFAQKISSTDYEMLRLKAEVYDLAKVVEHQKAVITRVALIVEDQGDVGLMKKLEPLGFQFEYPDTAKGK